ncbi:MAG: ABC transporter substrate-binding protein [Deltaproteobacteria bacterium]|nr:ABC transporter substrate-binding protein [Deltaproteobacteria bacterium]
MKSLVYVRILLTILLGLLIWDSPRLGAQTRLVEDSLGQKVAVPQEVLRVAPIIPAFCQVTEMLTRGGGKVVAFPRAGISDYFKKVFPDLHQSNPKGLDSRSIEDVIASGAQVLFGPTQMFLSDDQSAQLRGAGVSVVAVNGLRSVEELSQSFTIIGQILGPLETQRAGEFVRYYQGNVALAARLSSSLPTEKKLKVLFLYGTGSAYRTINNKDISHHYLSAAGGVNLAADYQDTGQMGAVIDPETIVSMAPEVIFSSGPIDRLDILADPVLAEVPAVKNGRVYACPKGIFVWFARSAEGAMMPLWLGSQLYPDLFKEVDMKKVVQNYFGQFYSYKIPADELNEVLNPTKP